MACNASKFPVLGLDRNLPKLGLATKQCNLLQTFCLPTDTTVYEAGAVHLTASRLKLHATSDVLGFLVAEVATEVASVRSCRSFPYV